MGSQTVTVIRVSWLVLCGMMLFSRFVFQAAGPVWMRSFLDGWKTSRTHRVWGLSSAAYGVGILIAAAFTWRDFGFLDIFFALGLVGVLVIDGLMNFTPGGFGRFKEQMQEAWVKRRPVEKSGDKHLFGTVNFLLGLVALGGAVWVTTYRPFESGLIVAASVLALTLMTSLLVAATLERRRHVAAS